MKNKSETIAEDLKNSDAAKESSVPGVRGKQMPVENSGAKTKADSPTNWSRSGNPLHGERKS